MLSNRFGYSAENCSVHRTLDIVGEKWSLLVLREAFYGVRRFEDFARALGCPRNILSRRLKTLVDHDILQREAYQELGRRPRAEYRLTPKGRELFPALVALMLWGDRWAADPAGPPIVITHNHCGDGVTMTMSCASGHNPLTVRDVNFSPGPGAKRLA